MKKTLIVFLLVTGHWSLVTDANSACSRANLTRCLDSACAINIGANPAARCQLCGTASAGITATGMTSITMGASVLSAAQLKSAPTDPGARYAWATGECIEKVSDCTTNDVSVVYDSLIERSCKAAGISVGMGALFAAAKKTKNITTCDSEIRVCMTNANRCGADYSTCARDADFDKFFATCVVEVAGCDSHAAAIRADVIKSSDGAISGAAALATNVVAAYQAKRATTLKNITAGCTNDAAFNECIAFKCKNNMKKNCVDASEKSMAAQLCRFYQTACEGIRK